MANNDIMQSDKYLTKLIIPPSIQVNLIFREHLGSRFSVPDAKIYSPLKKVKDPALDGGLGGCLTLPLVPK